MQRLQGSNTMTKQFSYTKCDNGYKLLFPDLINIRIPKRYHVDTFSYIDVDDKFMQELVDGLNEGKIKVTINTAEFDSDEAGINFTMDVDDDFNILKEAIEKSYTCSEAEIIPYAINGYGRSGLVKYEWDLTPEQSEDMRKVFEEMAEKERKKQ